MLICVKPRKSWTFKQLVCFSSLTYGLSATALTLASQSDFNDLNSNKGHNKPSAFMEEVVVTARKREESLQDTPISITAFSGDGMEVRGMTRVNEIAGFTPNLTFQNDPGVAGSSSSSVIFIRGIGQKEYTATSEPGVGLYVDGVYLARNVGSVLEVLDLERVEVLRGPQGTLFGRNTIGGAISITSKKPNEELATEASFSLGNEGLAQVKGMINLPLTDRLFVKFSAASMRKDGIVERTFDGRELGDEDRLTGRLALRWQINDNLEANLAFDATRARENGSHPLLRNIFLRSALFNPAGLSLAPPGFQLNPDGTALDPSLLPPGFDPSQPLYAIMPGIDIPVDNLALTNNYVEQIFLGGNCFSGYFEPYNPQANQLNPRCYGDQYILNSKNAGSFPVYSNDDVQGASLNLEYQVDNLIMRSITAYREVDSEYSRDQDASPLRVYEYNGKMDQSQFSQEFQVLGEALNGRLDWIVGAYYLEEKADNPEEVYFGTVGFMSGGSIDNSSIAAFGQGTFDVTDKLSLSVGLRYTHDEKDFQPKQPFLYNITGNPAFDPGNFVLPPEEVDQSFEEVTPMVNISYQFFDNLMAYVNYSEGFKSGGATQRVFPPLPKTPRYRPENVESYEVGVKFNTLDNRLRLNMAAFYTDYQDIQIQVFTDIAPITKNGGEARIRGMEVELFFSPLDALYLEAAAGYLDAEFRKIDPTATELTLNSHFEKTPEWTISAAASYEFDMASWGTLTPRIEWSYKSEQYNDALNSPFLVQDEHHIVNANINWRDPSNSYSFRLGVKNAFDEDTIIGGFFSPPGGQANIFPSRGREWYATFSIRY